MNSAKDNSNYVVMNINVFNIFTGANSDDKVKGQEVKVTEKKDKIVEAKMTANPDSSTFLLDMAEDDSSDAKETQEDMDSSDSWVEEVEEARSRSLSPTSASRSLTPTFVSRSLTSDYAFQPRETFWSILRQILFPFFLAGCGTVGAGLILDNMTFSEVFQEVPEIIIVVPALLGLKGNIEMTLASRLSTEANMGRLDRARSKVKHILGNMYLVQFQGISVGLIASLSPYWMGSPLNSWQHALLLSASCVAATSIASFFLGILMSTIVVISHKYEVNPDNVAAPLAASIGDIVTLTLFFIISSVIYGERDELPWLAPAVLVFYLATLPVWFWLTYKYTFSRKVLLAPSTWLPILGAMMVSSFAGKIFDHSVKMFKNIALLQPVINGVGGNIAAVQASRISTYLHINGKPEMVEDMKKNCRNPITKFFKGIHAKSAFALLFLLVPGHLLFITVIWFIHADFGVTFIFVTFYILAAILQVSILLYLADILVPYFWKQGIDPDNAAIPCLTSTGDFLGTAFLVMAFQAVFLIQGGGVSDDQLLSYFTAA